MRLQHAHISGLFLTFKRTFFPIVLMLKLTWNFIEERNIFFSNMFILCKQQSKNNVITRIVPRQKKQFLQNIKVFCYFIFLITEVTKIEQKIYCKKLWWLSSQIYIFVWWIRPHLASQECSIKYFIKSSFGSGVATNILLDGGVKIVQIQSTSWYEEQTKISKQNIHSES
jgi:hypothetical protein